MPPDRTTPAPASPPCGLLLPVGHYGFDPCVLPADHAGPCQVVRLPAPQQPAPAPQPDDLDALAAEMTDYLRGYMPARASADIERQARDWLARAVALVTRQLAEARASAARSAQAAGVAADSGVRLMRERNEAQDERDATLARAEAAERQLAELRGELAEARGALHHTTQVRDGHEADLRALRAEHEALRVDAQAYRDAADHWCPEVMPSPPASEAPVADAREEQLARDLRQAERVIAEQQTRIVRLESELAEARGQGRIRR